MTDSTANRHNVEQIFMSAPLDVMLFLLGGIAFLLGAIAFYFIPSIIATKRDHRQDKAIFVLNLFLGWTLIGWVAALVWALTNETHATLGGGHYQEASPVTTAGLPPRRSDLWWRRMFIALVVLNAILWSIVLSGCASTS